MKQQERIEKWHRAIQKVIDALGKDTKLSKSHKFHLYQMGLIGIATVLGDKTPMIVLVCLHSGRPLIEE